TQAICDVSNHIPSCACPDGYSGDPFVSCRYEARDPVVEPCNPNPCGLNSICRVSNGAAVCTCQPNMISSPPNCRPECVISAECGLQETCVNQKCVNPCIGTCGQFSQCQVISHRPICSCAPGYTGDAFTRCFKPLPPPVQPNENLCIPNPCGPHSECKVINESPACSCLPGYLGSPPTCRVECSINSECPANRACMNQKCVDPCPGSCGINARCEVINHRPVCTCDTQYSGDPFQGCSLDRAPIPVEHLTPCIPSPCGTNAVCREENGVGSCQCIPEHFGNPYEYCRPQCLWSSDCTTNRACVRNKCQDPCPGACGSNADCRVVNHLASCSCRIGYTGNPYSSCHFIEHDPVTVVDECQQNPCSNSCNPCGANSQCRVNNGISICTCLPGFIGSAPACRPECISSPECSRDKACVNQKCVNPCAINVCGTNADCRVNNHSPICTCRNDYTGNPLIVCSPIPLTSQNPPLIEYDDPCYPNPCGLYSQCQAFGNYPQCSCLPGFYGSPPNCHHECVLSSDCATNKACIRNHCVNPCPGLCAVYAQCNVINHFAVCTCFEGYTGNAFDNCEPIPPKYQDTQDNCHPSPCAQNAQCNNGVCTCPPGLKGDPYTFCSPECVLNSDCERDKACIQHKCVNPCESTCCAPNANCNVYNHLPMCVCPTGMEGNPFIQCVHPIVQQTPIEEYHGCRPSPCGPYSQCKEVNGHAVCSCLPNYVGSPPTCRAECIINSDCLSNQACQNQKCID
ncbi:neurogenic locus notch homolog protein 1-like, partial [Contarinia nasturtii]|uniref:neurogenic locus notch homolog protein 1-like n=1 Tax=Contarinia nasturtii TaxID=265458 RepID=UPI0012D4710B